MGLRFRKSIKLGGGARINFSKSGVGFSFGTKGARVTKKSSGGTRSTFSIPGTGISYVKESRNSSGKRAGKNVMGGYSGMGNTGEPKKRKTWLWVLGWLCIFPLPLTILLRKKVMKAPIKYGIIAAAWIVFLMIAIVGTSGSDSENTEEVTRTVTDSSEINTDVEVLEQSVVEPVEVSGISLKGPEDTLSLGDSVLINATIVPDNADNNELAWSSSDEKVATVDQMGNVTAVGGGQTTITATSVNGISTTCDVNVDATKRVMNLRVTHPRDDDNNIGDEWSYIIQINGENPPRDYVLTVGDKLEFYAKITESDDKPDVGEATTSHTVTEEDLLNGLTISMDVYVTENGGRNSGQSAHFVVTYNFEIK